VWRIVSRIGTSAMLDGTLAREVAHERDRERCVEEFAQRRSEPQPAPPT